MKFLPWRSTWEVGGVFKLFQRKPQRSLSLKSTSLQ